MRVFPPGILGPFILFEVFVQLTQPGGGKVWIEESHIALIRPALGHCHHEGKTQIVTITGNLCVTETSDQVRALIEETKKR